MANIYFDIALYKRKIWKDHPAVPQDTHKGGSKGVKQNVKPLPFHEERATGTVSLHTSPQSLCQTVYNMHTWESTKIEKVSLRRIDANLTFIAKTLNWLSLGINKFFRCNSRINIFTSRRNRNSFHPGSAKVREDA